MKIILNKNIFKREEKFFSAPVDLENASLS